MHDANLFAQLKTKLTARHAEGYEMLHVAILRRKTSMMVMLLTNSSGVMQRDSHHQPCAGFSAPEKARHKVNILEDESGPHSGHLQSAGADSLSSASGQLPVSDFK